MIYSQDRADGRQWQLADHQIYPLGKVLGASLGDLGVYWRVNTRTGATLRRPDTAFDPRQQR